MKLSTKLFSSITAGVLILGAASSCSENELELDQFVDDSVTIENQDQVQGKTAKNDSIFRISDVNGKTPDGTTCDPGGWYDCPACGMG